MTELSEKSCDRFESTTEEARHLARVAADEAFVAAMNRAIKKRKEKAVAGTFVDETPPISAVRIIPSGIRSGCGSPAAMCLSN